MNPDLVCCLSPAGASAIAVIGLRGPTVWEKVSPYFSPYRSAPVLLQQPHVSIGLLKHEDQGDEIVLCLSGNENHQEIELQLHGGPGIVQWCLQFLQSMGCQLVDWPAWNRDQLWYRLALATTRRTAGIVLDQCMGAMDRKLESLQQRLQMQNPDRIGLLAEVDALLLWESLGDHLIDPWKIVLAGPPNAGKSSLLNALVGYQRAITSPIPGTTRDLVSATLAWNGFPMEFIDTAGLHASIDPLERAGMEQTERAMLNADLVLWLIDLNQEHGVRPAETNSLLLVGTKTDLPGKQPQQVDAVVSATTGQGLAELLAAIHARLIPVEPEPGQAIPLLPAQKEELRKLRQILEAS